MGTSVCFELGSRNDRSKVTATNKASASTRLDTCNRPNLRRRREEAKVVIVRPPRGILLTQVSDCLAKHCDFTELSTMMAMSFSRIRFEETESPRRCWRWPGMSIVRLTKVSARMRPLMTGPARCKDPKIAPNRVVWAPTAANQRDDGRGLTVGLSTGCPAEFRPEQINRRRVSRDGKRCPAS